MRLEPLEERNLLTAIGLGDLPPIGSDPIEVPGGPGNSPPVLVHIPAPYTAPEMEAYSFVAVAFDYDEPAQTLVFSLRDEPAGAAIDGETGVFEWTPREDQGPAEYSFWVQVSDGFDIAEQEVTLHVTEVNRPPELAAIGDRSVDELAALEFAVWASDEDLPANSLSYAASDLPEGASFDPETQQFSWTPAEAQGPGSYEVTFSVSDGHELRSETITITVDEVNAPPVLAPIGDQEVDELSPLVLSIVGSDPDLPENQLTYTATGLPEGASFDPDTQQFSWTPSSDQAPGEYEVTFGVSDGLANDSETVLIQVSRLNQPPSIVLSNAVDSLPEDTETAEAIRIADIAIDDDGMGENVLSLSGPNAAWFVIDGGGLYLQAGVTLDYETQPLLEVTVEVDDPSVGLSPDDAVTLVIGVTDVNLAPTGLAISAAVVAENLASGTLVGVLTTEDPEPPAEDFRYALVAGAGDEDNGSFRIEGDELRTAETFNHEVKSSYSIRLRTTDAGGLGYELVAAITILDANDAPYLVGSLADQIVFTGTALEYSLPEGVFEDEDVGQALVLTASSADGSSLPAWLTFDGRTFRGTPTAADVGRLEIGVTATDSGSPPLHADAFFGITVTPHPRPWQNPSNPLDVNGDGLITAIDVLSIINFMNGQGGGTLPLPEAGGPPPFVDVTGDNLVTPLDALTIINFLNQDPSAADPSAEGEAPPVNRAVVPIPPKALEDVSRFAASPMFSAAAGESPRDWRLDPAQTAGQPVEEVHRGGLKLPSRGGEAWEALLTDLAADVAASGLIGDLV